MLKNEEICYITYNQLLHRVIKSPKFATVILKTIFLP